ncbi:MAG: mechanosensitive ion channel family protein [Candidatus Omnitrophica bacterium]|nr:mechanosensitive ion channel family protein [Candidatus Omnitrophota bacterium]
MSETLRNNIITLIYFLIIIVICFIAGWIWNGIFLKITSKKKLDNKIFKKTGKGVIFFIFFSGLSILWERTSSVIIPKSPTVEKLILNLPKIIYSFIVLSISFIISGVVDGFVEWYLEEIANKNKIKVDEEFMHLFQKISRIVIFFIGITIILNKFNQPITGILGAAGIASFAIAFAAQDTLSNMISGFFIIIDKPFKIGDRIKLATGEIGEVIEIGMRRTKILSPENNVIIISNSEIAKTRIINFGFPDTKIKIRFKIGIQPKEEIKKIKDLLINICQENNLIMKQDYEVYLIEYNSSQIIFSLGFIIDYKNEIEVVDRMINDIKNKLMSEKIELLFIRKE